MAKPSNRTILFVVSILLASSVLAILWHRRSDVTFKQSEVTFKQSPNGIKTQNIDKQTTEKILALVIEKYGKNVADNLVSIAYQDTYKCYIIIPEQTLTKREYDLLGQRYFVVDESLTNIEEGGRD
jgi:hypothetical protein